MRCCCSWCTPRETGSLSGIQADRGDRAIERAGAKLRFLPPCSPDFNPIEMAFSKIKALLKKAAARTREDPLEAIRNAIDAVTPTGCRSFFTATGYEPE